MVKMYCKKVFWVILLGLAFIFDVVFWPVESTVGVIIGLIAGKDMTKLIKFYFGPDVFKVKYTLVKLGYCIFTDEENDEKVDEMVNLLAEIIKD